MRLLMEVEPNTARYSRSGVRFPVFERPLSSSANSLGGQWHSFYELDAVALCLGKSCSEYACLGCREWSQCQLLMSTAVESIEKPQYCVCAFLLGQVIRCHDKLPHVAHVLSLLPPSFTSGHIGRAGNAHMCNVIAGIGFALCSVS